MSNASSRATAQHPKPKTKAKTEPKRRKPRPPPKNPPKNYEALSIGQFCLMFSISQAYFYKLQVLGLGPHVLKLRGRRFITRQAANDWLQAMEDESSGL